MKEDQKDMTWGEVTIERTLKALNFLYGPWLALLIVLVVVLVAFLNS